MTDLLSPQDLSDVFSAFKDLHDTFNKTTVVYEQWTDDFSQLDKGGKGAPVTKNLLCRHTLEDESGNDITQDVEGAVNAQRLKLMFNREYLQEQGLVDPATGRCLFEPGKDYFLFMGARYKCVLVHNGDTDFAGQEALWYAEADKEQLQA
jgi:hypothetical protein